MFKKVLIAEDHESANISVRKTLTDLGVILNDRDYVFYCDDALMRVQKAIREEQPYELLITDLSFEEDRPDQKISEGKVLIKTIKQVQPDLKILVFSIEHRMAIADMLVNEFGIDAFVPKARNDAKDLKSAIETIYKDKKYLSPNLKHTVKDQIAHEFTPRDIAILSLLSKGKYQKEIPLYLQQDKMLTSSLSTVEKRLNIMKDALGFSKNEQLIAYCKDKNII